MKSKLKNWNACSVCQGRGKKSKGIRKKAKLRYQRELQAFEQSGREGVAPVRPRGHLDICLNCKRFWLGFCRFTVFTK